jgi:parallel beta-helix repeat protein
VLVELSSAHQIRDAGIYVGSCEGVVMRYNTAIGNVAGMELENSSDGVVHNNYLSQNVGGLLVFKLPGPNVQRGHDHDVLFNVSDSNDVTPNFGIPDSSVAGIPPGTGMVVLSTRNTDYHHNIITNNDTYGIAAIDQQAFDALAAGALDGEFSHTCAAPDAPFKKCNPDNPMPEEECPGSLSCVLDQKFEDNAFFGSVLTNNGGANAAPGSVGAGNVAYAVIEEDPGGNGNCFSNLTDSTPAVNAPLGNTFSLSCP